MENYNERVAFFRKKIIQTAWYGKGGHITSALSMADILATLYWGGILRHDSSNPEWDRRDKFILSKAHGGVGFYTMLALEGYFPVSMLKNYCHPGQALGDHANFSVPGVENSGGSLGHGLAFAAGNAYATKLQGKDNLTYVLTGDGECQEGSIWESALFIGNRKLNNLVWIIDYNKLQANSRIDATSSLEPLSDKLEAFGFEVRVADGHDYSQLSGALLVDRNRLPEKPIAVIANTRKGFGVPMLEDQEGWHGKTPREEEYKEIVTELGLSMEDFINL